ncbi:MAG TPA: glycosyl hydrolase, partial [Steroidobacteraceae bacterium]
QCDFKAASEPLPHFWEHTVGSDHALMALRADWRQQLRRSHEELGFRHVRFHGLLSDDVSTVVQYYDSLIYSFFNIDQIVDFLLSIGMKPFVELSFMPGALASGTKTVFHYRSNVTQPRDYDQWAMLIRTLVEHWIERYGLAEVRQWFFEVWNEPNLDWFGDGKQSDYFKLYRYTARAIKDVDTGIRVGGPATAVNAWICDFLEFCRTEHVPVDFVTTHHYPNDVVGMERADTVTQLAASRRSALRDQTRKVRDQAGSMPVYYTEWCTSSNPRDPLHDEAYAAAFVTKTIMEANGLVQGYSYWTFSDIFEENYFPSVPFHGGFGLLNIHGIAKPSYRAFQLLHHLGTELLPVEGAHATVDVWVVRRGDEVTILLTNFALPRHPIASQVVRVVLRHVRAPSKATIERIDQQHANAKRRWQELGEPEYPDAKTLAQLHAASELHREVQVLHHSGDVIELDVEMPPLGVAAVTLTFTAAA